MSRTEIHLLESLPPQLRDLLQSLMGKPDAAPESPLEAAMRESNDKVQALLSDPKASVYDCAMAVVESQTTVLKLIRHSKSGALNTAVSYALLESSLDVLRKWTSLTSRAQQEINYENELKACGHTIDHLLIQSIDVDMGLDLRVLYDRLGTLRGLALLRMFLLSKQTQHEESSRERIRKEEKLWECYVFVEGKAVGRRKTDSYLEAERYGKMYTDAAKEAGQPAPTVKIVREGDDPN